MNISFVFPGFLFATALIAIPIIIHLFNFRRFRKVYFTNVHFLKELKEETTSQSRLKHLLVLLARILAVIFLVLAFAQPYIPAEKGVKIASNRTVSMYVDNSFSMEAVTREGTLLDVAKKKAGEIASAYKPSDRFQLVTNSFDPVDQRLLSREEFISALDLIKVSPSSRKSGEVISRQTDVLNNAGSEQKSAIILSDFQQSMVDFGNIRQDSSIAITLVPITAEGVSNAWIDSCWFSSPVVQWQQPAELNVRIRNNGDLDLEAVPVKLVINGTQKAVASASIPANNYTDLLLTFTAVEDGWQRAQVSIIDNPITFDDHYYFSFSVSRSANILSVNNEKQSPYLTALFGNEQYFKLTSNDVRQIDYAAFAQNRVIILNELPNISSGMVSELSKYVENGGTLVMVPDSSMDFVSFGNLFNSFGIPPVSSMVMNQERVEKLMLEDPVFQGVFNSSSGLNASTDLPMVEKYFLQGNAAGGSGEKLLQLRSGAPLLSRYLKGKGEIYVFYTAFSGGMSNFARHAIFVPVMYRIALLSERPGKMAHFIGVDEQIELPPTAVSGDEVFHIINEDLNFDIIPGHRTTGKGTVISVNSQITQAANYDVSLSSNPVSVISYNFNRDESVMKFFDEDGLTKMIESLRIKNINIISATEQNLTGEFSSINEGTRLWKYCILLVLLFLAFEILLLKFWKK